MVEIKSRPQTSIRGGLINPLEMVAKAIVVRKKAALIGNIQMNTSLNGKLLTDNADDNTVPMLLKLLKIDTHCAVRSRNHLDRNENTEQSIL
jgi:hypothetical protein